METVVSIKYNQVAGIRLFARPPSPLLGLFHTHLQRFQCRCEGLKVIVLLVGTMAVAILAVLKP